MSLVEVSGSELYSKFYGETEGRLRDKFEEAKRRYSQDYIVSIVKTEHIWF